MNRVLASLGATLTIVLASAGLALADIPPDPQPDPNEGCGCGTTAADPGSGAFVLGVAAIGLAWVLRSPRRRQRPTA